LDYGGNDVTQSFYYLLQKAGFPYKGCQLTASLLDCALLSRLKETYCHLNLDLYGLRDLNFTVEKPGKPMLRYQMKVLKDPFIYDDLLRYL